MLANQNILISGAGISGLTLAYWLHEWGFSPVIVEKRPAYQQQLRPEIERRQKDARGLAGSFIPRNKLEIWITYFFLRMAFMLGFSSLFKKQIGANSIIKYTSV